MIVGDELTTEEPKILRMIEEIDNAYVNINEITIKFQIPINILK